ncbi:MAG: 3-isopropylmalate dehydratase small subunit [Candidatus Ratteibacteria bacterium]|nr:3-isopropylmalate dehydratase small subunit [Candidatus Ratteibacteria bacterium]
MIIKGKVHKFGDNINTDEIIPAPYLVTTDMKELGKHCMEGIDASFAKKVQQGDIIVAGKNFGCGSSREHAPLAILGCGISLVIAGSFARIFYRNCINVGLPILTSGEIHKNTRSGDILEVDLLKGEIKNITQNKSFQVSAFPPLLQEIIKAGGLMKWYSLNKQLESRK